MKNKRGQVQFSNFIFLIVFLVVAAVGGLLAGILYYDMSLMENTLHTINFDIPIESGQPVGNITDFQSIMGVTIYPLLGLKSALPYLTYFMIFAFIIALGITAYLSSKNAIFFVLHILFTALITYFSLLISNMYKSLIADPFINSMMLNFTIYNKLMFFLPQIVFFVGLLFGAIAFINVIKPNTNNSAVGLNYGGDY